MPALTANISLELGGHWVKEFGFFCAGAGYTGCGRSVQTTLNDRTGGTDCPNLTAWSNQPLTCLQNIHKCIILLPLLWPTECLPVCAQSQVWTDKHRVGCWTLRLTQASGTIHQASQQLVSSFPSSGGYPWRCSEMSLQVSPPGRASGNTEDHSWGNSRPCWLSLRNSSRR